MPDSSKSLSDRLKEGVFDFCERMADVEAGRRNQYVGISQQMHDAEDERRRLRKKAKEGNEQGRRKKVNDDAGGDENHGGKDTQELGERWKTDQTINDREVQNEKTTEDNLRKDKAVDKGAAHGIGKLQEQQISESSSDEELQWATDRMMMGDLDEVPVEIEQSEKNMPNSSNATKDPPLRLRGGAGGAGRWRKLQDSMNDDYITDYHNALREEARGLARDRLQDSMNDDYITDYHYTLREEARGLARDRLQDSMNDDYITDYHNALREEARGFARDRSQYKEKHVHFDESAQEPHRNPSFGKNPRAGHSTRYDWGTGARAPTFTGQSSRGERHQHGGRSGPGLGQSSSEHRGKQRTGFGFSEDVNFREWSSSKDNGGKRRAGFKFSTVHSGDEEESYFESSSHNKGKDKSRGGNRTRSQFDDEDADDADEYWKRSSKSAKAANESSSHNKGKDKSRGGNRTRSQFDDEDADDADEYWKRSSKSAKAAKAPPPPPPPDHYGVLGLTRYCSAQEVKEASKRMRIQTHPDRLKKEHMSAEEKAKIDETAANVGFAAEVLSDPELREGHDRLVRRWERKYSPY